MRGGGGWSLKSGTCASGSCWPRRGRRWWWWWVQVIIGQLFHLDGSQAEWHFLCPAFASPPAPLPRPPPPLLNTLRLYADRTGSCEPQAVGSFRREGVCADNGLAHHRHRHRSRCRRWLAAQLLSNATVTGHEKPY